MDPKTLRYTSSHEWASIDDAQESATVGITAFAVEQLTDPVMLELPEVGKQFKAGEVFGVVESVKAVSDLFAPLDIEITEINEPLPEKLELLSEDPFGEAWLFKAKILSKDNIDKLLDYETYEKQCAEGG